MTSRREEPFDLAALEAAVDRLFAAPAAPEPASRREQRELFGRFRAALESGAARAAEPDPGQPTGWRVNPWVKRGILLGFRIGGIVDQSAGNPWAGKGLPFYDKDTYPVRRFAETGGVRIVPGGSAIRAGTYVAPGVVCMPPMYVNVGAYVDSGTLVDSHALVGSCSQIGKKVHLSAAAQIGGVLEPVGASPVIVEDGCLVGGNCGVYEGTVVKRRAVLGAGVILTRSTPLYDLVHETIHRATDEQPLVVPEGAVVVAGARAVARGAGKDWGISLYTPVIVKYRDEGTEARVQLEAWLRLPGRGET